jgi:hypothetical protein
LVAPIPDHAFFEKPEFKRLFCHHFFQILGFAPQFFDFIGSRGNPPEKWLC